MKKIVSNPSRISKAKWIFFIIAVINLLLFIICKFLDSTNNNSENDDQLSSALGAASKTAGVAVTIAAASAAAERAKENAAAVVVQSVVQNPDSPLINIVTKSSEEDVIRILNPDEDDISFGPHRDKISFSHINRGPLKKSELQVFLRCFTQKYISLLPESGIVAIEYDLYKPASTLFVEGLNFLSNKNELSDHITVHHLGEKEVKLNSLCSLLHYRTMLDSRLRPSTCFSAVSNEYNQNPYFKRLLLELAKENPMAEKMISVIKGLQEGVEIKGFEAPEREVAEVFDETIRLILKTVIHEIVSEHHFIAVHFQENKIFDFLSEAETLMKYDFDKQETLTRKYHDAIRIVQQAYLNFLSAKRICIKEGGDTLNIVISEPYYFQPFINYCRQLLGIENEVYWVSGFMSVPSITP